MGRTSTQRWFRRDAFCRVASRQVTYAKSGVGGKIKGMANAIEIRTHSIPDEVRSDLEGDLRQVFDEVVLHGEGLYLSHDVPAWISVSLPIAIASDLFHGILKEIGADIAKQGNKLVAKAWVNSKPHVLQWPHDLYHALKRASDRAGGEVSTCLAMFLGGPRVTTFDLDLNSEESFVGQIILLARAFPGISKAIKGMQAEGNEFPTGIRCAVDDTGFTITWCVVGPAQQRRFDLSGEPG